MNDSIDGFNIPSSIAEQLNESIGSEVVDFLKQWADLTRKSLLANKEVIFNCLTVDVEDGHILCRFCGEGIPNWKQDNAREHKSECPINGISEVLSAVKKMHTELSENVKNKTLN